MPVSLNQWKISHRGPPRSRFFMTNVLEWNGELYKIIVNELKIIYCWTFDKVSFAIID